MWFLILLVFASVMCCIAVAYPVHVYEPVPVTKVVYVVEKQHTA